MFYAALAEALKAVQGLPVATPGSTLAANNAPNPAAAAGAGRSKRNARGTASGSTATPAGCEAPEADSELRVGDRVQVLAVSKQVAALGTVTAVTEGFQLSNHPDDTAAKVCCYQVKCTGVSAVHT